MDHDDFELDDATLQGAVRQAWGDERAPQRLRGRIGHLIATARSVDEVASPVAASGWDRWSSRVYAAVAAAVLLFGFGSLALYYNGFFTSSAVAGAGAQLYNVPPPKKTPVPISLVSSLIATHTNCGKHDHHLVDPAVESNYAALTVKLTADLGFPALARGVGTDWTFLGAGECVVDGNQVSHLMFARGDVKVSVFTLPLHCTGVEPGGQFDGMVEQHPVAGFARPGALYAVVGSSGATGEALSLETVTSIRDQMFSRFDIGCGDEIDSLEF
jgi:hypothetical protein